MTSSNPINFDGKVAVVTGAGAGLGKAYALDLGRRGAKVVVNDLGSNKDGSGTSEAAISVANEIRDAGGEAIAIGASVTSPEGMKDMVEKIIQQWGRVDIFVANAGILRDRSFSKMSIEEFETVIDVHLRGTVLGLKAVWPHMIEQNYGRIVVTTSVAGLFGNFGQANYGSAKSGLVGLMNTLKLEGERNNIKVNAISPGAMTQMTEQIIPENFQATMAPERVAPAVTLLCSEEAPSGVILQANGGIYGVARMVLSQGTHFTGEVTAEDLRESWDKITDTTGETHFKSAGDQGMDFFGRLGKMMAKG